MMKRIHRVLLVYPPTTIFPKAERKRVGMPLGIAYVAAFLEREGYEVKILDATVEAPDHEVQLEGNAIRFGLSYDSIKNTISSYAPDVVGVSIMYTSQADNGHAMCRLVKEVNQEIVTVVGGAHATSQPEEVLEDQNVDFAVLGEGELAMKSVLHSIEFDAPLGDVDGIAYRTKTGLRVNPKVKFIQNLDELPLPAWHLLSFDKYFSASCAHSTFKQIPYAPVFTSRGCPFNCSFCFSSKVHGARFRARSAGNVIAEIQMLVNEYGVKEIHFEDDNLTFDRKRAFELFSAIITNGLNISWTTPSGVAVATLDEELLTLMKKSGCYKIILGVESGSQRVVTDIMRKPLNLKKVEEIMHVLKRLDMPVGLYFVIGVPGETKEEIEETISFAAKLRSIHPATYSGFSIFTPFKGTKLYEVCRDRGYIDKIDNKKLKLCFSQVSTPEFTSDYIERMRKIAWQRANNIRDETDLEEGQRVWIPMS